MGRLLDWRSVARMGAIFACVVLLLQFVRPKLPHGPATAEIQVPDDVKEILRASCYNCHSNELHLSWFDYPVPAYWLVVHDVREGRSRLNFSELGRLPLGQQRAALFEAISQIELDAMPLPPYRRLHPESTITSEKLAVLKNYLRAGMSNAPATMEQITAGNTQYANWIPNGGRTTEKAKPAPNGIAFIPQYKNWTPISSTDRTDNNTMRQILGNDVAVSAMAHKQINPWPDGTVFAKVAWLKQVGADGSATPGPFYQVEFMIRDRKKYAKTKGWGWARWRGTDLKPYGKDQDFANECVGCHSPLATVDYVFTMPIRRQQ